VTIVWADTETFSEQDIKGGSARYARDPSTRIQLKSFAFDDDAVQLWSPEEGEKTPSDLRDAFRDPSCTFYYHNSYFDRQINENCLGIVLPLERYRCVMARALSHSLPASLENLGVALGLSPDQAKMREGKKLVQLFCKPNKDGVVATFKTHPEEWERYKAYCVQDTAAMRAVCKMIPHWNYKNFELKLWFLDQKVNDRGLQVDVELAKAATALVGVEKEYLDARTKELTRGAVGAATQRDAIKGFIADEYGVDMENMQKATVQALLESDVPGSLKELLKIRRDSTTTSSAKYKALLGAVCDDGRLRGTIQYAGASRTLRDGGRLFQPQNLPRPTGIYAGNHELIDEGIQLLKDDIADIFVPNVMELMSSALRSVIVAAPGKKLVISDLSAIEGRVLAWLAGEEWVLDAYRKYDKDRAAGLKGIDLYMMTYAKSFNVEPESVNKDQRPIGKVMDLFLGFAGGVGAFVTGAATYHIDLKAMAEQVLPTVPKRILTEAGDFYDWIVERAESACAERICKTLKDGTMPSEGSMLIFKQPTLWAEHYVDPTHGLERDVFIACDSLKRLWRESHPATTKFWFDLKDAVVKAVNDPVNVYRVGKHIEVTRSKDWLRIILPSGHNLCYPMMKVSGDGGLSFMGEHPLSKNWERLPTFHGRLVENVVQAVARDIFKFGEYNAEEAGYSIVLPVHDENVTEVPDTEEYSVAELSAIMSQNPTWAADIPLAAAGFETYRYRKE
jgi:DNA polymerase